MKTKRFSPINNNIKQRQVSLVIYPKVPNNRFEKKKKITCNYLFKAKINIKIKKVKTFIIPLILEGVEKNILHLDIISYFIILLMHALLKSIFSKTE